MDVTRRSGGSPWSDPTPFDSTTVRLSGDAILALDALVHIFREDRDVVVSRALVFTFKRNVSMARYLVHSPKVALIPILTLLAALVGTGAAIGYKLHERMFSPVTSALFGGLFVGMGLVSFIAGQTNRYWLRKDEKVDTK